MENSMHILSIEKWIAGERDFTCSRRLFEEADEYISLIPNEPYNVSKSVMRRTYSKGTEYLFAYGYYTKSVFDIKCISNSKRGRLIDYKPWFKSGLSYNF